MCVCVLGESGRRKDGKKCETAERQMIWPLSRHDDSGTMAQLELIRIINWRKCFATVMCGAPLRRRRRRR